MNIRKTLLTTTAIILFSTHMALAELTTSELIAAFQEQGYNRIEIKVGPTQIKVEAIMGTAKSRLSTTRKPARF
ncbi:MAG: hypothetical protein ACU0C9_00895 [Paracoccaceae bacterium]